MRIRTSKGEETGTAAELSAWLEMNQPAYARVVVLNEFESDDLEAVATAHDIQGVSDSSGWTDGEPLRNTLCIASALARRAALDAG